MRSEGGLPNDIGTHFIASKDKENVMLATLLLEKSFNGIEYSYA